MTVTIRDVARDAKVSVATVSRVLNASGPVHPTTSARVREAAERLRYVPHGGARSLVTSETYTLGVVLPDIYGEFFSEVIRGLDAAARGHGYHLLLSSAHASPAEMKAALRSMRGRVDGLVVMLPDLDALELLAHLPDGAPVVLLNRAVGQFPALTIDNHGGARAMVRHLLALGHRRIGTIVGAKSNADAGERLRGYRAALAEAAVPRRAEWEVRGDFTEAGGHAAVGALLAAAERPTAIFAANDAMAIGALSALREAGVRVPHEMAVAGFDDIPMARYVDPPLSSVHVPIARLGTRAVERLMAMLHPELHPELQSGPGVASPMVSRHEKCATTLVIRRSCGGRASGDAVPPASEAGRDATFP
jgi:LacI family transcriptional regulator